MSKITVGMPLYNNAKTLRRGIESVLSQTEKDFSLLLSDDGSDDNTWNICQEYARIDERITIVRQNKNLYYHNFLYLVENSNSKFFCWLAGDDYMGDRFIELCISELEKAPSLVACVSKCEFTTDDKKKFMAKGTYSIEADDRATRVACFFKRPADNTRMYGVFRRDVLQKCFPRKIFHAYDWALSALTLCQGGHRELDDVLLFRHKTPSIQY
jgi:glycosyltransferase involved in cell wall biosynthesis